MHLHIYQKKAISERYTIKQLAGYYKMILPQLSIRTGPAIKWSRRVANDIYVLGVPFGQAFRFYMVNASILNA